jgi:hypothetical protein
MELLYKSSIGEIHYNKELDIFESDTDTDKLIEMYNNYFSLTDVQKNELLTYYSLLSKDAVEVYPTNDFQRMIDNEVQDEKYEHASFYSDYLDWRSKNLPDFQKTLKKVGINIWQSENK